MGNAANNSAVVELGSETESFAPRRVLIVDDSRAQRKILSIYLKNWGYQFDEAASGAEALELCKENTYDLILSDWIMPGMTGIEFCEIYRAMSEHYAYFILITAKNEKDDVSTGLSNGADDFLARPVDPNELHARIVAGERILRMQSELRSKNDLLTSTLDELQGLYDNLDRDLVEARHLQQSLVPERFLAFDGADVSLLLRPSGHVGGDLVGAFRVNDNRIGVFSIDVSGHGIASALMTARLAGHLTGTSPDHNVALTQDEFGIYCMRPTEDICARLNDMVLNEMDTEHYFTIVIADCDLRTGHVRMSQAGHPQPIVQRADGSAVFVGEGGLPVGLLENASFDAFEVTLNPGDRLFLCSDGFSECPNEKGDFLDDDGLMEFVLKGAKTDGPELLETLVWDLSAFAGPIEFPDDVSAVLLEFQGR